MQDKDSPEAPAAPAKHDPYGVFRNRDFRLYLTGRLFATVGQQMFAMALGWELYERTHSSCDALCWPHPASPHVSTDDPKGRSGHKPPPRPVIQDDPLGNDGQWTRIRPLPAAAG